MGKAELIKSLHLSCFKAQNRILIFELKKMRNAHFDYYSSKIFQKLLTFSRFFSRFQHSSYKVASPLFSYLTFV